jgi:hypothetical protein
MKKTNLEKIKVTEHYIYEGWGHRALRIVLYIESPAKREISGVIDTCSQNLISNTASAIKCVRN